MAKKETDCSLKTSSSSLVSWKKCSKLIVVCFPFDKMTWYLLSLSILGGFVVRKLFSPVLKSLWRDPFKTTRTWNAELQCGQRSGTGVREETWISWTLTSVWNIPNVKTVLHFFIIFVSSGNFPLERPKKSRSMIFRQFFVVLHTIGVEGVLHRIFRVRVRHPVLQMAIPDPVLEQNI